MSASRRKALVAAIGLVIAAPACFGGPSVGDTTALVVGHLFGAVRARNVTQQSWYLVKKDMHIPAGATVQVPPRGDLGLKRGALSTVELRPYDGQPAEMRVIDAGRVDVASGDVLVKADRRAPISVTSQGVTANPAPSDAVNAPIFRFDRRVSVRVGVYSGSATITSLTGDLPIPPLREGVVAARALPRAPTPLTVDPNDIWDRALLPDVIDVDAELGAQSRGYQAAFGERMHTWKEIAKVAPTRNLGFVQPYLADTGSADVLIGVVFSLLLEQRAPSVQAPAYFSTLLTLLDQGATWGLLAHQYLGNNGEQTLKDAVTLGIALRTGDVKNHTGAVPTGSPSGGPSPSVTPTTTTKPTPTPTHSPSPTPTPTHSPSPSPSPSCFLPPLIC
jgi:hypothetical protein